MIHPDIEIGSLVWLASSKMSLLSGRFTLDNFNDNPESNDPVHYIRVPFQRNCKEFYPALVVGFGIDPGGNQTIRLSFGDRGTFTLESPLLDLIWVLPWDVLKIPAV